MDISTKQKRKNELIEKFTFNKNGNQGVNFEVLIDCIVDLELKVFRLQSNMKELENLHIGGYSGN